MSEPLDAFSINNKSNSSTSGRKDLQSIILDLERQTTANCQPHIATLRQTVQDMFFDASNSLARQSTKQLNKQEFDKHLSPQQLSAPSTSRPGSSCNVTEQSLYNGIPSNWLVRSCLQFRCIALTRNNGISGYSTSGSVVL